jgi:transcription elongation factor Elf1
MSEFVALTEWVEIQCPYCGEHYETQVDLSAGSQRYIEDCQICCAPIECTLKVDDLGALDYLHAARQDE